MHFRDVLPATLRVLEGHPWSPQHDVVVVRDLHGKVRLVIRTSDSTAAPLPDDAQRSRIEAALGAAIGPWLGSHTPVWCAKAPERRSLDVLFGEIDARRKAFPGRTLTNLWLVERHTAKQAWTGELEHRPPWPMQAVDDGHEPAILVFFSHKGGVGRTTALAATALHFSRAGLRTVLVDLDLEAPGLGGLFSVASDHGVVDHLVEQSATVGGTIRDALQLVTDSMLIGGGEPLRVVPAGRVDAGYVEMLARLDLQNTGMTGGLRDRLRDMFTAIRDEVADLRYILVDARAGLHDLGGVMLASLCHGAVLVGLDSNQSWQGVRAVGRVLAAASATSDPVPLILVQGMGPPATAIDAIEEEKRFRDHAFNHLGATYYPADAVPDAADRQQAHWAEVIRWRPELRGGGDALAERTVAQLLADDYRALAERVARLHGNRLDHDGDAR